MKKILFCKYNTSRSRDLQTKTIVYQEEQQVYVEKQPLFPQGAKNIERFSLNYELIKDLYPNVKLLPVEKTLDGVRYPYVEGKRIDEVLDEVSSWKGFFEKINELVSKIYVVNEKNYCEFEKTEEFCKLFGEVDCSGNKCISPCNIDMIFDNIVISPDGTPVVFDYEWVSECSVPEVYVRYRAYQRLYNKYYLHFSVKYTFDDFLRELNFSEANIEMCKMMEQSFVSYISCGGEYDFPPMQYVLNRLNCIDIRNNANAVELLHDTEKKYLDTIDNLNTAIRIKEEVEDALHNTEDVLHDTEKKYLDTIDNLNSAVRIKEEVENALHNTEDVLHDTEKKYLDTIDNLNDAVRIKEEVENLLHETERKYLETIENLDEAARKYIELENLYKKSEEEKVLLQQQINEIGQAYNAVVTSKSWKITKPVRAVNKAVYVTKTEGIKSTIKKTARRIGITKSNHSENQVAANEYLQEILLSLKELELQKNKTFQRQPLISIITPLFNTPEKYLIDLLESLKKQTYKNWQFCLVNFGDEEHTYVDKICKKYAKEDARFDYHIGKENRGISENTNECISYANGEYIGLLDHDDILHESALYEVVKVINNYNADFIYTDEIKFEEDIRKSFAPNFKPDFSADELRAHNYICHFCVYSTELFKKTGGYRKEFDGSQDHDIVLRLTEKAERIIHIPKILYFWRVHPGSVASGIEAKSYATKSGENAVTEQFQRMSINQRAESVINNIPLYRFVSSDELKDRFDVIVWGVRSNEQIEHIRRILLPLEKCVLNKYYIVENEVEIIQEDGEQVILKSKHTYGCHYNQIINSTKARKIVIMNACVRQLSENLQNELTLYQERKDVATIDVKLLRDDELLSGGLFLSGDANMPFKIRCMGGPKDYSGYENAMLYSRNVSASLGLFTVFDVNIMKKTSGFDEKLDAEAVIEYSYRAEKNGYRNIWTPFIEISVDADNQMILDLLLDMHHIKTETEDAYLSKKVLEYCLE